MCRKRHEPFKCEYVPKDRIVMFIHKHPVLWQNVYKAMQQSRDALHEFCEKRITKREYHKIRKEVITNNPHVKALNALLLLEFNYMDSTLSSRGLLYRMKRIYEGSKRVL